MFPLSLQIFSTAEKEEKTFVTFSFTNEQCKCDHNAFMNFLFYFIKNNSEYISFEFMNNKLAIVNFFKTLF